MSEIVDCMSWVVRKTFWSLGIFLLFLLKRFADLLGLIFNLLACCTIVRLPAMIHYFMNMLEWEWEQWWYTGLVQVFIFLSDIPFMLMGLIVFATLIRIYPMCKELSEEHKGFVRSSELFYSGCHMRGIVAKHFATLAIDLLCIPSALVVLLSW